MSCLKLKSIILLLKILISLVLSRNFLEKQFTADGGKTPEKRNTSHYGLPYMKYFSHVTKEKLRHIFERRH